MSFDIATRYAGVSLYAAKQQKSDICTLGK